MDTCQKERKFAGLCEGSCDATHLTRSSEAEVALRVGSSWGKALDFYKPCELVTGCGQLQEGDATSSEATPFHHVSCHGGDTQSGACSTASPWGSELSFPRGICAEHCRAPHGPHPVFPPRQRVIRLKCSALTSAMHQRTWTEPSTGVATEPTPFRNRSEQIIIILLMSAFWMLILFTLIE